MKNIGLGRVKTATADNFTTDFGIKFRRFINKPTRKVLSMNTKGTVILESYPKLEKNKPYIFVSTHSFDEDIVTAAQIIDRSAYVLIGTTDQIDHNPMMYGAWAQGLMYVDRMDKQSRAEALKKMERILNARSSVLVFAEGGLNNSENLLVNNLFASPYILAKKTGCEVVPISSFNEFGKDEIYTRVGNPLNISNLEKKDALKLLRDELGGMMFDQIQKYSTPIKRAEITDIKEARYAFMEERKNEYLKVKWTRDVWDEELTVYKDKDIIDEIEVYDCLENVKVDHNNFQAVAPALVKHYKRKKDKREFDFKAYMHKNWNK